MLFFCIDEYLRKPTIFGHGFPLFVFTQVIAWNFSIMMTLCAILEKEKALLCKSQA